MARSRIVQRVAGRPSELTETKRVRAQGKARPAQRQAA
jgi:hypothetical protein